MVKKQCKNCGQIKMIGGFYKHPRMKDGHVNICIDCKISYAHEYAGKNRDEVYKRSALRARTPEIKERSKEKSKRLRQENPQKVKAYNDAYIARNKEKRHAHVTLNNAIKYGKIVKQPCSVCGNTKSEGHHEDYTKPLDVIWLCRTHHAEIHRKHI